MKVPEAHRWQRNKKKIPKVQTFETSEWHEVEPNSKLKEIYKCAREPRRRSHSPYQSSFQIMYLHHMLFSSTCDDPVSRRIPFHSEAV